MVDASVAVKWLFEEPQSDSAERLYTDSLAVGRPLLAPSLFPNEVTNAIYRQLRRGRIEESRADEAIARFDDFGQDVRLLDVPGLTREAYAFAKRHQLGAIYDSLYVVLARDLDADLWTDDRALLSRLAAAAPCVRWIGDYPPTGA